MKVFVVSCNMYGCEECGDSTHIVGVYSTKALASIADKAHADNKKAHLHSFSVGVEEHVVQSAKAYHENN